MERMFEAEGLLELTRWLASADPGGVSDDDLFDAAVALERADSLLAAARAHVLAELDARSATEREFGLGTAAWVAREAGGSAGSLRGMVLLGRRLRSPLAQVDDALVAGVVSVHHARVLAAGCNPRIAEAFAGVQGELIDAAEGTVFDQWRLHVRRVAELLDQDGPHDPNAERARNRLRLSDGLDGLGHLDGSFTAEQWLGLKQAVEDRANELFRRYQADHQVCPDSTVPTRATLRALALAELVRDGLGVDIESTAGPRTEITLIARRNDDGTDTVTDPNGVALPTSVLPRHLCDPDVYTLIVDSLGVPVDMGRKIRLANRAQRRAIAARDGGCVFPGCDKPIDWCHMHHTDPYDTGGRTDVANMAGLCNHHHNGTVHTPGWHMHTTHDGWFWFQTPTGRTFWSQRHFKQRTGPAPPPTHHHEAAA
jgi:hypothetical protein